MIFSYNVKRIFFLFFSFLFTININSIPLNFTDLDGTQGDKPYYMVTKDKLSKVESFYDIIGLENTASVSDVKKAYRKAVLLFSPDKAPFFGTDIDPESPLGKKSIFVLASHEELFKLISTSFETLSFPDGKAYPIERAGRETVEYGLGKTAYDRMSSGNKIKEIKNLVRRLLLLTKDYEKTLPPDPEGLSPEARRFVAEEARKRKLEADQKAKEAEAKRVAEQLRQAEIKRAAEREAKMRADEERRAAARMAAEQRAKEAAEKQAEEEARAAEARKIEAERIAEQLRQAEIKRAAEREAQARAEAKRTAPPPPPKQGSYHRDTAQAQPSSTPPPAPPKCGSPCYDTPHTDTTQRARAPYNPFCGAVAFAGKHSEHSSYEQRRQALVEQLRKEKERLERERKLEEEATRLQKEIAKEAQAEQTRAQQKLEKRILQEEQERIKKAELERKERADKERIQLEQELEQQRERTRQEERERENARLREKIAQEREERDRQEEYERERKARQDEQERQKKQERLEKQEADRKSRLQRERREKEAAEAKERERARQRVTDESDVEDDSSTKFDFSDEDEESDLEEENSYVGCPGRLFASKIKFARGARYEAPKKSTSRESKEQEVKGSERRRREVDEILAKRYSTGRARKSESERSHCYEESEHTSLPSRSTNDLTPPPSPLCHSSCLMPNKVLLMLFNGEFYEVVINGRIIYPNVRNYRGTKVDLTPHERQELFYELLRWGFLPHEILRSCMESNPILKRALDGAMRKLNYSQYQEHIERACRKGKVKNVYSISRKVLLFFLIARDMLQIIKAPGRTTEESMNLQAAMEPLKKFMAFQRR